jgi:hypothetical protein
MNEVELDALAASVTEDQVHRIVLELLRPQGRRRPRGVMLYKVVEKLIPDADSQEASAYHEALARLREAVIRVVQHSDRMAYQRNS